MMKIEILGSKKIRNNGVTVLRVGNIVFKIPLSGGARKEMRREKVAVKEARSDDFFFRYLPPYKFIFLIQIIPYLDSTYNSMEYDSYIIDYFKHFFQKSSKWKIVKLENLLNDSFLNFIKEYTPSNFDFFCNYVNQTSMPRSSAHGDFYKDNILLNKNKLFFIDWSRYGENSSRYFDLIDFFIYAKRKIDQSWMDVWFNVESEEPNSIYEIKIEKQYLYAYAVWKVAGEIDILKLRNSFTDGKEEKYRKFILLLGKVIRKNNGK